MSTDRQEMRARRREMIAELFEAQEEGKRRYRNWQRLLGVRDAFVISAIFFAINYFFIW